MTNCGHPACQKQWPVATPVSEAKPFSVVPLPPLPRATPLQYSEVVLDPPVCGKTKITEHLGEINTKINTTMNTLGFEYPSDFFGQNHFLPHVTIMMVSRVNFLAQQSQNEPVCVVCVFACARVCAFARAFLCDLARVCVRVNVRAFL